MEREAFPSDPALEFIGWNAVNIQNAFPSNSFHNCYGTRGPGEERNEKDACFSFIFLLSEGFLTLQKNLSGELEELELVVPNPWGLGSVS